MAKESEMSVTDINEYRAQQDEQVDQYLDDCDVMEEEIQVSMAASIGDFINQMADHYEVEGALIAEAIVGAILGRSACVIRDLDDDASKDLVNYMHELSGELLDNLDIRKGRDQEERLEWRSAMYSHRLNVPEGTTKH
jgi:hypothetical protein